MGGGGGTTATARGGSDLTTGLGFTAGFGSAGLAVSGCTAGCSGAWATGVLAAPGGQAPEQPAVQPETADRKSTRLNSSHLGISYAVFCLKKKTIRDQE